MIVNGFIIASGLMGVGLLFFVSFSQYEKRFSFLLGVLALVIPVHNFAASQLFTLPVTTELYFWQKIYGTTAALLLLLLTELSQNFLRSHSIVLPRIKVPVSYITRTLALTAVLGSVIGPWAFARQAGLDQVLALSKQGQFVAFSLFCLALMQLYILETMYRNAEVYQRRIARLCFLSFAVIATFQLVLCTRSILFQSITPRYIDLSIIINGVSFPLALLGFIRYRLGVERIYVSRESIYSSITLLLAGAMLLGLATAATIIRQLGFAFDHFELFLVIFSVSFFTLLLISSGNVRIRIIRFVNTHFYKLKYDYRDQFFRLHQTYLSETDLHSTVVELVENMKYSVAVEDAFVFLNNVQDGNFYLQANQETATPQQLHIDGNNQAIKLFEQNSAPLQFDTLAEGTREKKAMQSLGHVVEKLHLSLLFPITHQNDLVGLLGIRSGGKREYDEEDFTLINVFTLSIGNVLFKNRLLNQLIEHKQFESFNHVSAFIIHDIKNQVATLNLLSSNVEKNITNPAFQKSLIATLQSTATNLTELIDKLKAPPRGEELQLSPVNAEEVISAVVKNSAALFGQGVTLNQHINPMPDVLGDFNSLFYILKNLLTNSFEAIESQGTITLQAGEIHSLSKERMEQFGLAEHLVQDQRIYIAVADTGRGMHRDYVENRLFQPFATTKDKGVGIGLYQCKTLIEKMNGRIFCRTKLGAGTTFCIIL